MIVSPSELSHSELYSILLNSRGAAPDCMGVDDQLFGTTQSCAVLFL